jgi:hypothetical protein
MLKSIHPGQVPETMVVVQCMVGIGIPIELLASQVCISFGFFPEPLLYLGSGKIISIQLLPREIHLQIRTIALVHNLPS